MRHMRSNGVCCKTINIIHHTHRFHFRHSRPAAAGGIQAPLVKCNCFTNKVCSMFSESWWNLDTRLRGYDGLEFLDLFQYARKVIT